ncbi:hypothetical protein V6N13_049519 [Hibiscus sabdariffa]
MFNVYNEKEKIFFFSEITIICRPSFAPFACAPPTVASFSLSVPVVGSEAGKFRPTLPVAPPTMMPFSSARPNLPTRFSDPSILSPPITFMSPFLGVLICQHHHFLQHLKLLLPTGNHLFNLLQVKYQWHHQFLSDPTTDTSTASADGVSSANSTFWRIPKQVACRFTCTSILSCSARKFYASSINIIFSLCYSARKLCSFSAGKGPNPASRICMHLLPVTPKAWQKILVHLLLALFVVEDVTLL